MRDTMKLFAGLIIAWAVLAAFVFFYNLPGWCEAPEESGVPVVACSFGGQQ